MTQRDLAQTEAFETCQEEGQINCSLLYLVVMCFLEVTKT